MRRPVKDSNVAASSKALRFARPRFDHERLGRRIRNAPRDDPLWLPAQPVLHLAKVGCLG